MIEGISVDDELEELVMATARGEMEHEPMTIWMRQRRVRLD